MTTEPTSLRIVAAPEPSPVDIKVKFNHKKQRRITKQIQEGKALKPDEQMARYRVLAAGFAGVVIGESDGVYVMIATTPQGDSFFGRGDTPKQAADAVISEIQPKDPDKYVEV